MKENSNERINKKRRKLGIGIILLVVGIILIILGEYSKHNALPKLTEASEFELLMFYVGEFLNTIGSFTILCSNVMIVFGLNNALTIRVKDSKKERSLQNKKGFLALGIFILISGVFLIIILNSLNHFTYIYHFPTQFEYFILVLLPIFGIVIFLCSIVVIAIDPEKNNLTTGIKDSKKERSLQNKKGFLALGIFILISGVFLIIILNSLIPLPDFILLSIFGIVIFLCSIVVIAIDPEKNILTIGIKDSKKESSSLLGKNNVLTERVKYTIKKRLSLHGKILFILISGIFVGRLIYITFSYLMKEGAIFNPFEEYNYTYGFFLIIISIIIIICSILLQILVKKRNVLTKQVKDFNKGRSSLLGKIFLIVGFVMFVGGSTCIEYYWVAKQGEHSSGFEIMMAAVGETLVLFGIIIILCSIPILILVRKFDTLTIEEINSKNVRSLRNGKIFLTIGISLLIIEFFIYRIYNSMYPYVSPLYIYDLVLGFGTFLTIFGIIIITYSTIKLIFAY